MGHELEETLNLAGYERVKGELAATYPKGQFVGMSHEQVVADGANLDELIAKLRAGPRPAAGASRSSGR